MNTRFNKQIIMPGGVLGRTTLLDLPDDDLASVQRWHSNEWAEFLAEVKTYKRKAATAARDALNYHRQNCLACRKVKSLYRQRGSIIMSAFGKSAIEGGDCSFTASTIANLTEFNTSPDDSYTRARLHSDGDWYSDESTSSSWGSSDGTWKGGCAIAAYDTRWLQNSGDAPNHSVVGSDGAWTVATTSAALGYGITGINVLSGDFDLELRDGTSLNVLFSDTFTMLCTVEA